ncbi:MAG: hypothetical protein HOG34_20235 [Bacteroidetes bacterium]|nr:hypothetical protein [Bacteroidota bacterium]
MSKIQTVARFEMKTLFRSWFFRIFSVLTLFILLGTNIGMLTDGGNVNLVIRSIASNIPYMNMAFLNIAQALLAIFLASDFLKRDKKLDTTEVIYTRSMTNWEYVWGKTFGVLIVFTVLNILVFLMALIINMVVSGVEVDYMAYLLYPLLVGFPTLLFTLGLAFFLMSAIRNQAVTLILLIGLTALSLFFVKDKVNHLFDFMAFTFPMMWSDMIGSGNLFEILLHRGIYLFLGLAFIFATILLLKRLPQSRPFSLLSVVLMTAFFILGIGGGATYWSTYNKDQNFRQEVKQLNNEVSKLPISLVKSYDLELEHLNKSILASASLQLDEPAENLPEELIFSLNPGLVIDEIKLNGKTVDFSREMHIIRINKPGDLSGNVELLFSYKGTIDERICYLDIKDEYMAVKHGPAFIIGSPKRHGIIQDNFVLLTPESVWYPISGGTFGTKLSSKPVMNFSTYKLNVKTHEGLTAISQGKAIESGDSWEFTSNTPFKGISLAIGEYETKTLNIDSLEVQLSYYKDHSGFLEILDLLEDTLPTLVKATFEDYERSIGLDYPFNFLKLVEAPVQFYSYDRVWSKGYDYVQPGVIFYPENLSFLRRGDLGKELERAIDRAVERDNPASDKDLQIQVFNNVIRNNFIQGERDFRMMMRGGNMNFSSSDETPYSIFPNYFSFVNNIESSDYQLINSALESYIGSKSGAQGGFASMGGISDEEKANLALAEHSFAELMDLPDEKDILPSVIEAKGKQLFNYLEAVIGSEEFITFITEELKTTRFKNLSLPEFGQNVMDRFNIDISAFLENWYSGTDVPSFLVTDVRNYEIQDGDNTVFQLFFTISNTGSTDGIVNVSFRTGGGGGGRMGHGGGGMRSGGSQTSYALAGRDDATNLLYLIPAETAYEYAIILDDPPRMMSVNTLISSNLPASIAYPFPDVEKKRMEAVESISETKLITSLAEAHELIVDNEDSGFSTHEEGSSNKMSGWLGIDQKESDFKYQGM